MKLHVAIAVLVAGLVLAGSGIGHAQDTSATDYSEKALMEMRKDLEAEAAKGNGSASKKLHEDLRYYTMIALREKSGGAELHEHYADLFWILEGHASLITEGTVENPKTTAPGEIVGTQVLNGKRQELHKGDVVPIPAGTPHQMLLGDGETIFYFVTKIKES